MWVVIGTGPTRDVLRTNGAIMGAGENIVVVGLQEDVAVRFPVAKETGCDGSSKWFYRRCGGALASKFGGKTIWDW